MSTSLSLSQTARAARWRVTEFSSLYRLVLVAESVFALALLIAPDWAWSALGLPPTPATAFVGVLLLWSVAFQVPGLLNPVHARLPVVIGVIGRYALGATLLWLALWLAGAIVLVLALSLNVVYYRLVISVLMSRP